MGERMTNKRGLATLKLAAGGVVLSAATPALAQTAVLSLNNDTTGFDVNSTRTGVFVQDRNVSVLGRPHPGYDPVPYQFGSFLVSPSVTGTLDYNDNLLASPRLVRSSAIGTIAPLVVAQSNWSSSYLEGIADANIEKHTSHSEEDRNQWLFGTRGRYDVDSSTSIQAGATAERRAEPRTASTAPVTDHPIAYNRYTTYLGGTKDFNRFRIEGFGKFQRLSYFNDTSDGIPVDQHFRNRSNVSFNGQAEYSLAPG